MILEITLGDVCQYSGHIITIHDLDEPLNTLLSCYVKMWEAGEVDKVLTLLVNGVEVYADQINTTQDLHGFILELLGLVS